VSRLEAYPDWADMRRRQTGEHVDGRPVVGYEARFLFRRASFGQNSKAGATQGEFSFMTNRAANFLALVVEPTAAEFLVDRGNIRRGHLAAITLFHLADYWWLENNSLVRDLRQAHETLISECRDFILIRDVANASKHCELTNRATPPRQLTRSAQISRTPGLFQAPFGEGVFNEASIVMVKLDNGTTRPLDSAVSSVLEMWKAKLAQANYLS
jgi:hypothetical protein